MDEDNLQSGGDEKDQATPAELKIPDQEENKPLENLSPESEMEVHHHPQLQHSKKPWKEYILEGFMIFIAVMMGFIAENIREGITNREHARELVSQLAQDLQHDTSRLNYIFKYETEMFNTDSELMDLLQKPMKEIDISRLQSLISKSHSLWPFYPSGGARTAIKNEIHLKEFSSSKMIGLIAEYEGTIALLHTVTEITLQYQRMYIDPFLVEHYTSADLNAAFNNKPNTKAEVRNLSQEDLTRLGSEMSLIGINTGELLKNNRQLFNEAVNILQYIRDRYKLPEE
jgi:hypothetical protein